MSKKKKVKQYATKYDRATLVMEAKERKLGFADFLARLVRDTSDLARVRFAVACKAMEVDVREMNLDPMTRKAQPVAGRRGGRKKVIAVRGERGAVYGVEL